MTEHGPEDKRKKWFILDARSISNLVVVLAGILFYIGLSNFGAVREKVLMFTGVLMPFITGFAIAYLLNTPMGFFERKVFKTSTHCRTLSILTVYLLAVALLIVLINLILPQVVQSIVGLAGNMSLYMENLNALAQRLADHFHIEGELFKELMLSYQDFIKNATVMLSKALPQLLDFGVAVGNGLISAVTALISSIYMLAGKGRLVPQIKKMIYAFVPAKNADRFLEICRQANGVFVGFINGKLIDSAIIGVLCFVLCMLFRIPLEILISVIIGVTNIIPFFGPIVGAIPCMMILLVVDPWAALRFLFLVIALQQFDGNILGPKILGDSTGLSAIWVLVAIVVGGGLFGFPGMILGVPTFAVLYALMRELVTARLAAKGIDGASLHNK
ncbi:MAG: AI-2E family transporter [Pseudoflavonifractor sp.]